MKILVLASYGPSLVNFRGKLIEALVTQGHEVYTAAPDMDSALLERVRGLGATPHSISLRRSMLSPIHDALYCLSVYFLIRRVRPDLLFSYTIKPNIWGSFAAAIAGVPSVAMLTGLGVAFTNTGTVTHGLGRRLTLTAARILYRWSTSLNRRVIFQNSDDRTDFIAAGYLRDQRKAALVDGSGIDTSHFARAELVQEPVFLMIARLLNNKGVHEYAEAARLLRARYPEARFRLVGPYDPGIDGVARTEVAEWAAAGIVDYLGATDDVRTHISRASVVVLPSYREGTPRSVLEAMAMGRAIVTTNVPGCRETIREGVEGFLVPPRDFISLAAAMERFLIDPSLCISMGQKAYERAKDRYEVGKVNQVMLKLLLDR
ncbi:RfaG Glycosyltransferase [Caulobacteraceae bacterium]